MFQHLNEKMAIEKNIFQSNTLLHKTFAVTYQKKYICQSKTCKAIPHKVDSSLFVFSIELLGHKGSTTLHRLIDRFFATQIRDVQCDYCGPEKIKHSWKIHLVRAPQILIIQIKRFIMNTNLQLKKDFCGVIFTEALTLHKKKYRKNLT